MDSRSPMARQPMGRPVEMGRGYPAPMYPPYDDAYGPYAYGPGGYGRPYPDMSDKPFERRDLKDMTMTHDMMGHSEKLPKKPGEQ